MTTAFAIRTVLEILAVLFVIYGVLHEDKFIKIEDKIILFIAKKIYQRKRRKAIEKKKVMKKAQATRKNTAQKKTRAVRYAA